jgi:2-polyprenyl-3-methyl-5-hydroxy-6-metoxy-1,4-benzoquinol methylase
VSGRTWDPSVFDRIYAASEDPWAFRSSPYEQEKYRATLDLLPERRFGSGLEIGCSIGVLTAQLAQRCGALLAIDCAEAAIARAQAECAACEDVRFAMHHVPGSFPDGRFELIVVSEVLYFLSLDDVARLAARCDQALLPGGVVLLANWTGQTDTPSTGEAAADAFIASSRAISLSETRRAGTYRLDRLVWRGDRAGGAVAG